MLLGFSFADLAFGGAQVFFVDLIERLSKRRHKIRYHLFASQDDAALCDPRLFARINRFAKKVPLKRILKCDVIHLDGYHTTEYKKPFLARFDRCVETFHSEFSFRTSGPNYAPNKVVVSNALKKILACNCELIYQGIDTEVFCPADVKKDYDVAILGRIHPAKNHVLFLDVCRHVARTRPISALIIGGYPWDDTYAAGVRRAISELQGQGLRIEVTGFLNNGEVPNYLGRARFLLVTSPSEGFGRMAAEALACEVPVIANPVGGLVEIVQHGSNGFLAEYNDPRDFARLTLNLLNDDLLRERLGRQGRKDVLERFSVTEMVSKYEQLYKKVSEASGLK